MRHLRVGFSRTNLGNFLPGSVAFVNPARVPSILDGARIGAIRRHYGVVTDPRVRAMTGGRMYIGPGRFGF